MFVNLAEDGCAIDGQVVSNFLKKVLTSGNDEEDFFQVINPIIFTVLVIFFSLFLRFNWAVVIRPESSRASTILRA
jgi:hypothetical protein